MKEATELVKVITEGIQEKKGNTIVIADLQDIETRPCDYFVICNGNSPQQVDAITDSICEFTRKEAGEKPARIAGRENSQWVAADYGNVIVHIFLPELREFYDLDHLWEDAKLTAIPDIE